MSLTPCGCSRSVAVLAGLFAVLAACILIAEDKCRDGGGVVGDAAWTCAVASGGSASLWSLVPSWAYAAVALAIGVPVYLAVNAIGRRLIAACGLPAD